MSAKRNPKPTLSIALKGLDKDAQATVARCIQFQVTECFSFPMFCENSFIRWLVRPGDFVHEGKTLLRYHLVSGGAESIVRADESGIVNQILAKAGEIIVNGQILCELRSCAHDESIGGICTNCGADVSALEKVQILPQSTRSSLN